MVQHNILVHKMSDPLKVLLRFLASGKIGIWSLSRTQSEVGPGTQCGKTRNFLLLEKKNCENNLQRIFLVKPMVNHIQFLQNLGENKFSTFSHCGGQSRKTNDFFDWIGQIRNKEVHTD